MTKLHKAKILDGLNIEYKILETGEMFCFVNGEWINAGDYINSL